MRHVRTQHGSIECDVIPLESDPSRPLLTPLRGKSLIFLLLVVYTQTKEGDQQLIYHSKYSLDTPSAKVTVTSIPLSAVKSEIHFHPCVPKGKHTAETCGTKDHCDQL